MIIKNFQFIWVLILLLILSCLSHKPVDYDMKPITAENPLTLSDTSEFTLGPGDEIRVEMNYAGLCGTGVHLVETNPDTGYIRCSAPAEIPPEGRIIGHERVARVLEVGSNVYHVKPGDCVTIKFAWL